MSGSVSHVEERNHLLQFLYSKVSHHSQHLATHPYDANYAAFLMAIRATYELITHAVESDRKAANDNITSILELALQLEVAEIARQLSDPRSGITLTPQQRFEYASICDRYRHRQTRPKEL